MSKRQVVSMMSDLFGVELALGSVTACEQRTSEALAEPVAEARRYVEQQPSSMRTRRGGVKRESAHGSGSP